MSQAPARIAALSGFLELAGFLLLVPQLGILAAVLFELDFEDGVDAVEMLQMKLVQVPLSLLVVWALQRRHGEGFRELGLVFPRDQWRADLARGLKWIFPLLILSYLVRLTLNGAGLEAISPFVELTGISIVIWLGVAMLGGGVVEEIQYRGFVFRRLEAILPVPVAGAMPWMAMGLTSVAFAVAHAYQGSAVVGTIWVLAMALQWIYLSSGRRLLPVMICHAGFNALQIALLASFSG